MSYNYLDALRHHNATGIGAMKATLNTSLSSSAVLKTIEQNPFWNHTRVTLTAAVTLIASTGGAAKAGGVKLWSAAQEGLVIPHKARITGTFSVTGTGDSTAGEIGLGTVIGSGAAATLGGTATFENLCEGGVPALGNATAGGAAVAFTTGDGPRTEVGTISTAADIFLNAASTFAAGTGAFVVNAGTVIDVWWGAVPVA